MWKFSTVLDAILVLYSLPGIHNNFKTMQRKPAKTLPEQKMLENQHFFSFFPHHLKANQYVWPTAKFSSIPKSFPQDKILDLSKFKAFTEDEIKASLLTEIAFQWVSMGNTVGKGGKAFYQHFLLYSQCFQKAVLLYSQCFQKAIFL